MITFGGILMKSKSFLKATIALAAVGTLLSLSLVGCGKQSDSAAGSAGAGGKTVKIGAILPLSGEAAPLGENSKKAIDMAVEEINEKGGIKSLGGARLEVVYGDSQGKPPVGVSEAERLLADKDVVLLTGSYQSGVTLPASEVAERNKKIWFASVPSDDAITKRGFKYLFRLADTSEMRVKAQIQFLNALKEKEPIQNIALVYENTAWGQGVAKQWKEKLPPAGYTVVLDEAYDKSSADFTPVATKVKNANPDVVLLVSYTKDATLLTKAFVQQKVQPKAFVATSGGYADPEYIKNAGDAAVHFFDLAAWETDVNRPYSKETDQKFFDKYGMHMNGEMVKEYVGIYTIADALERAASTDSEKLREAFASANITQGPTQIYAKTIHFDETGTMPDPNLVMVQFQKIDGKVERVTVWPKEDARPGAEMVFPYKPAQ
jgi:branched-chain amino acid transport system substrate-binding protein